MLKFTIILRRKQGLTHQQFVDYHRNQHADLFKSLPEVMQHVRRYVQCHAVAEPLPGMPDTKIDGSTEIWVDDAAALQAIFTSPDYMAHIRPDEEKFLDLHACEFLLGTENVVIAEQ